MKRKYTFIIGIVLLSFIAGCSSSSENSNDSPTNATMTEPGDKSGIDYSKGKGKFTEVILTHPLDKKMVDDGATVYKVKCFACHKLTEEKLVGPGWKGVTDRRKPEWIMNFVTNTDEMIDKDPSIKALVDKCMVRMPNQHLRDDEARSVLEFMRSNDGKNE